MGETIDCNLDGGHPLVFRSLVQKLYQDIHALIRVGEEDISSLYFADEIRGFG